jgi:hypothetical protein
MSNPIASEVDLTWNFYNNQKWPYDLFIRTYILKPMEYGFVKDYYDRSIGDFRYPAKTLERMISTLPLKPEGSAWFLTTLDAFERAGVRMLFAFIDLVATRKQAEELLQHTGLPLLHLMGTLDFFKQWWFPFGAQLRQLVEDSDQSLIDQIAVLKKHGFAQGFKFLDSGRTRAGRKNLAGQTGIPDTIILDLVHRADVTRIPYVSGGTVKRMWAIGYNSLESLRSADPEEYFSRVSRYYASLHKANPFDARLEYIRDFLGDARRVPEVVEE